MIGRVSRLYTNDRDKTVRFDAKDPYAETGIRGLSPKRLMAFVLAARRLQPGRSHAIAVSGNTRTQ